MPYRSFKQDAYLHIHEPGIAKRWDAETKRLGLPFPTKGDDKPAPPSKKPVKMRAPSAKTTP